MAKNNSGRLFPGFSKLPRQMLRSVEVSLATRRRHLRRKRSSQMWWTSFVALTASDSAQNGPPPRRRVGERRAQFRITSRIIPRFNDHKKFIMSSAAPATPGSSTGNVSSRRDSARNFCARCAYEPFLSNAVLNPMSP